MLKFLILLTLLCAICLSPLSAETTKSSFQAGDSFKYALYWSFIKVGEAELRFDQASLPDAETKYLRVTLLVATSGIADRLFKVRDHLESYLDPISGLPVLYQKQQREGKTKRDIEIRFDHKALRADYTKNGKKYDPVLITDHTYDPLSLITALAMNDFEELPTFEQATTDGKDLIFIKAWLQEAEKVKTKAGKFSALKLKVATNELEGVFEKSPDAEIEIWLSQDTPAIPLKMRSEVIVGSFHGELIAGSYQGQPVQAKLSK